MDDKWRERNPHWNEICECHDYVRWRGELPNKCMIPTFDGNPVKYPMWRRRMCNTVDMSRAKETELFGCVLKALTQRAFIVCNAIKDD